MDYIKLLNLQSEPFSNSPDPSFFYLSPAYQDCLQNIEISIRLRRGLNLVLGDIGIGKTTLSRALIQQFQSEADRFQFHLILDPSFESENEFLYALIMGFGISRPGNDSLFAYKESIRQFLLDEGLQKGRVIVLIVDEGQKLNGVCLELLRDLLNFETNQFKLLQLIIMAQKEFNEKIKEKRNLTDRINTFYEIRPLDRNETLDMIQFRLQKAGWTKKRPLFSSKAIDRIYHHSGGYPRRIITLCHHSLLFMLIRKSDIVEPEMVDHAISQLYEYREESNKTRNALISNTSIHYKPRKRFTWVKLVSPFYLKRLMTPVLLAILIFFLFLTLHWGKRNMDLSNLGYKNTTVEKPIITAKLNTQGQDIQELDTQDLDTQGPDTQDIDTQALGNRGLETQELYTQPFGSQMSETPEPDTFKQDIREPDMQPFPVHAFENKDKLNFNTYLSDISETISDKKIKRNHMAPDSEAVSMVVSEGDTVFKLARKVYAIDINSSILKKIRQSNPHISDLDHIEVGDRIFFPKLLFSDEEVQKTSSSRRDVN
jgi:type II secretory pathway predicted ATPase ExeA